MARGLLLSIVLLLTCTSTLRALTITQTQGFMGWPNIDKTVEFDRFNPERGTLQSVHWAFTLGIEGGSLVVDNDGDNSIDVPVTFGASGTLQSTDVPMIDSQNRPILSAAGELVVETGGTLSLDVDQGDNSPFDPNMSDVGVYDGGMASVSGNAYVDSVAISDYVGTTLFQLDVDILEQVDLGDNENIQWQSDPMLSSANITLIYNYSFVPEPSAVGLLTLGCWGLLIMRRRRV